MARSEQSSLAKFGFDTTNEARFLSVMTNKDAAVNYLEKQLKTQLLHVSRNIAVSLPYPYWLGAGDRIFTDPKRAIPLQIDPRDRDGLYQEGLLQAMKNAKEHPMRLQFLYSPPGPVNFNSDPDSPYQRPYNIGQLYLIWSNGNRIDNIAVSINQQGEEWVEEIFGRDYFASAAQKPGEIDRIKYFITNPICTDLTIDDFMLKQWQSSDKLIFYSNNSNGEKSYYIADVMKEMQTAFVGQLGEDVDVREIAKNYVYGGGTRDRLDQAYLDVYRLEMIRTGRQSFPLGGNCSGSAIEYDDLFGSRFLVKQIARPSDPLSSEYRRLIQSSRSMTTEEAKNDSTLCRCGNREPHFHCPGKVRDEKSGREQSCNCAITVGKGVRACPKCGLKAICS